MIHAKTRHPGILKSIGGKASQVEQLAAMLPRDFKCFIDPFMGGGSLPFHLRRVGFPGTLIMSDINRPVMTTWEALRDHCDAVVELLESMRALTGREAFEAIGAREALDPDCFRVASVDC